MNAAINADYVVRWVMSRVATEIKPGSQQSDDSQQSDIEKREFMHSLAVDKVSFVDHPANEKEFLLFKALDSYGGDKPSESNKKRKKKEKIKVKPQTDEIEKANVTEGKEVKPEVNVEATESAPVSKARASDFMPDVTTLVTLQKTVAQLQKENESLKTDIQIEKEHRVQDVYLTKAALLPFILMEKAQLAGVIRFFEESGQDGELKKSFSEMMSRVNSVIKTSSVYNEVGRSGSGSVIAGADDELIRKAQDRIAKSSDNKSLDEVVADIIREEPELYHEHLSTFSDAGDDLTQR